MQLQAERETEHDRIMANVDMRNVLGKLVTEMKTRFPDGMCSTHEYAVGHFLHPFWKGALLKNDSTKDHYDTAVNRLVNEHQLTIDFLAAKGRDPPTTVPQVSDEDKELLQIVATQELAQPQEQRGGEPPLRLEITMYERMTRPTAGAQVDILKWWRGSENQFPTLFKVARYIKSCEYFLQ